MRVLIIGGTGLISTAISTKLLEMQHEVLAFNRGKTRSRVEGLRHIPGDRRDFEGFERAVSKLRADAVIDMLTFDAETARHSISIFQGRTSHYVFFSTVCVYGGVISRLPADEQTPHQPVSEYGRNKSAAEAEFLAAHQNAGFPVTILRPAHCYGAGGYLSDATGRNSALIPRVRASLPLLMPGNGLHFWQPGHVDDLAPYVAGMLGQGETIGEDYNLVSDEYMAWQECLLRLSRAFGSCCPLAGLTAAQFRPEAPPSVSATVETLTQYSAAFDNAKLKRAVPIAGGFRPWEVGVLDTAAWLDAEGLHQPVASQPWYEQLLQKSGQHIFV